MNRDHSVFFEIACRSCIWDSFVDYYGYSFSSKGFLPTGVDIMVIWVKFTHSSSFYFMIPRMLMFTLAISCLTTSNSPWFMDLTFQVPIQYCFLQHQILLLSPVISTTGVVLLWLHPFILSGVISPLISSSVLGTYWPREFIFSVLSFCLLLLFMGFSRQEYWSGLPFPSPVDHVIDI